MRPLHFHICAGNRSGAIFGISESTDGPRSVVDFLDMSYKMYGKSIGMGRLDVESKMNKVLENGEQINITIGQDTPLMLVWSACTCDVTALAN